ncbi:MAG: flippase [Halobacteriota archaeon]|jgi:O-antigen/teichoic acid export membrane protein
MDAATTVGKNILVFFASQIASMGLGFFYLIFSARYLGPGLFGLLTFGLAFTGIFGLLLDLGLNNLAIREVARDKSHANVYLSNITFIKLIMAVITFGLIAVTAHGLGYSGETVAVVYLLTLSAISVAFTASFYAIFQSFEKMEYQSVGAILSSLALLTGAVILIARGAGVVAFAAIYLLSNALELGYSFFICTRKFHLFKVEVDFDFWGPTIRQALPFGLSGVFVTIYFWIDSLMLALIHGNEAVGWYSAGYRLVFSLLFIPAVFNAAVFPAMSRFHVSSRDSLQATWKKYLRFMLILGIPIAVGTTLLAGRIIALVFGEGFAPSVVVLQLLVWSLVFIFASAPFFRLFESTNKQVVVTKITGLMVIVNVAINLALIPKFSYVGASIATLVTEFIVMIVAIFLAERDLYVHIKTESAAIVLKIVGASAVMALLIVYLQNLNLILIIVSASLVYFGTLYVVKGIEKEDISLIKSIIRGNGSTRKT